MSIRSIYNKILLDYFRWVAMVVVAGILLLGYFFLIEAKVTQLRTSGFLERSRVTAELEAQESYLNDLRSSLTSFDQRLSAAQLAEIDSFIPTGSDFPGLLVMLDTIAKQANLQLASMNVTDVGQASPAAAGATDASGSTTTVGGQAVRIQDVSVTFEGGTSYDGLKRFIELVESSRRLLDVVSLNFSHSGEAEPGVSGSAYSMVVRTYYVEAP